VTDTSDEIIMLKVKNGKLSELEVLFDRYHLKLYNFFLKLTFDKIISQDLTQNVFYRIIKYKYTYKEESSFKSWIYQLARNVHIDNLKQNKKYSGTLISVENYNENIPNQNVSFNEEDFDNLDKALVKLKPEQREIIVLSRFQGLKYEDISQIRNTSVTNIKVQVHRAIKQLRDIYFKIQ
jgi:RNA polymerase sigma factor (sigma-70 family)